MAHTTTSTIRIADSDTTFGVLFPVGTMVFDEANKVLYQIKTATTNASDTINILLSVNPASIERLSNNIEFKANHIQGDSVNANTMVMDNGWATISNKQTTEQSYPQLNGTKKFTIPIIPAWTVKNKLAVVYSGHEYTFTKPGWVEQLRVWVETLSLTTNYRVIVIIDPYGSSPIYKDLGEPILKEGEWTTVAMGSTLVKTGTVVRFYLDSFDSATSTQLFSDGWTYIGDSNNTLPATTEWNTRNSKQLIRIHPQSLGGNYNTQILNSEIGTIWKITESGNSNRWIEYRQETIATLTGSHYQFNYLQNGIGIDGPPRAGEACLIIATAQTPNPTFFVESDTHWSIVGQPSFANVTGYLKVNGVEDLTIADSAFGVDLLFQEGYQSPDWDIIAASEGGASSQGFVPDYNFTKIISHTVVSTGPTDWDDVGNLPIVIPAGNSIYEYRFSLTWNLNSTNTSAYLRFSLDNGVSWSEFRSEPKDNTGNRHMYYSFPKEFTGLPAPVNETILLQAAKENGSNTMIIEFLDIIFAKVK